MKQTQTPLIQPRRISATTLTRCALFLGTLFMGACNSGLVGQYPPEGIGYHQARFEEITALREYRACRNEAMELDDLARTSEENGGKYLASARLLEKCEANLGPHPSGIAREERMRAYALSVINYLKGGDPRKARENLENFKSTFTNQDLYLADGTSFVDTMERLFLPAQADQGDRTARLNLHKTLQEEMKRVRYWSDN